MKKGLCYNVSFERVKEDLQGYKGPICMDETRSLGFTDNLTHTSPDHTKNGEKIRGFYLDLGKRLETSLRDRDSEMLWARYSLRGSSGSQQTTPPVAGVPTCLSEREGRRVNI